MLIAGPHVEVCLNNWAFSLFSPNISLMSFVSTNSEFFVNNADNFSTRSQKDLHLPIANLSVFQKGVYFCGIKIYNNLPTGSKQISYDTLNFKKAVKRFLFDKSFYSLDEYYKWKENVLSR